MTQVRCDFCGKLVRESEAEQSVVFIGFSGFPDEDDEITKEIKHFYCSEQHKALSSFLDHSAFYGSREHALDHIQTMHGIMNIRKLVKTYEDGDPLPDVKLIEPEEAV